MRCAHEFYQLCARSAARAGVEVAPAWSAPLDTLMAWREEVLRDVFELSPCADISALMAANRAHYRRALADKSLVPCFAWPLANARPPEAPTPPGIAAGATSSAPAPAAPRPGEPVATGVLCLQYELPSPDNPLGICGYLMNIYTRPLWRGRGVGRAIVSWLCAHALERHAGKIFLETTPAARALYESLGFSNMVDYLKL